MTSFTDHMFSIRISYINKDIGFEYIWLTIHAVDQTIKIDYQATDKAPRDLVKTIEYKLREPVIERIPPKHFSKV